MAEGGTILFLWVAAVMIIRWVTPSQAIWLSLPSSGTKCVSQEIYGSVVVMLDYSLVFDGGDDSSQPTTISARVSSPFGNTFHYQENVTKGQAAFTTSEAGIHVACFWVYGRHHDGAARTLDVDWKIGITAKDWDSVAKKEKIEGVELELVRLEALVEDIRQNIILLKEREAKMRNLSETTNAKVAWLSLMSISVCIAVAALQLWHLQRYFRKKKLI